MKRSILLILFFCAYCNITWGSSVSTSTGPWLTGPLITGTARVIPVGKVNVEPYLFSFAIDGFYGPNWEVEKIQKIIQVNPQLIIKAGIANNWDVSIFVQSFLNRTGNQINSQMGDCSVGFDYQLYAGPSSTFVRLSLIETLPIGRYHMLDTDSQGTDIGGQGSFITTPQIGAIRLFHIGGEQYFRPRISIAYSIGTSVRVKGFNSYGGDPTTRGHVDVGSSLNIEIGAEYTLSKRWALACDFTADYTQKSSFKGITKLPCGLPSFVQYTLAPAIEYNWSESMGLILGSWFTIAGRNCASFYSVAAAFNYFY